MPETLVIGYGNAIRGDDAIGHRAACELMETVDESRATIIPAPQLAPEMAHELAEHDLVVFIDASCEGEPGEIRCRQLEPEFIPLGEMPHALKPIDLLGLAHQLYDSPPRAVLVTLCGEEFRFQEQLSETVEKAFPRLIERVERIVADNHD